MRVARPDEGAGHPAHHRLPQPGVRVSADHDEVGLLVCSEVGQCRGDAAAVHLFAYQRHVAAPVTQAPADILQAAAVGGVALLSQVGEGDLISVREEGRRVGNGAA